MALKSKKKTTKKVTKKTTSKRKVSKKVTKRNPKNIPLRVNTVKWGDEYYTTVYNSKGYEASAFGDTKEESVKRAKKKLETDRIPPERESRYSDRLVFRD